MYNYDFKNGHCLIDINGNNWFLDTGCPRSFSFDNDIAEINIEGIIKPKKLGSNPGYKRDAVEKAIGERIKGIIGADILSETSFSIYTDNTMEFKANPSIIENPIKAYINGNVIIGKIKIEDIEVNTLFDSGAAINYLKPNFCKCYQRDGVIIDIDREGNEIKSKPCLTISQLGDRSCKLNFGIPVDSHCGPMKAMHYYNCDAIVGLYDFDFKNTIFSEYFIIDYKNKKMYIK